MTVCTMPRRGSRPEGPQNKGPQSFGAYVRDLRVALHMTQGQLADLMDTSQASIGRWETSMSFPRPAQIPRLAQVLRVSVADLMGILERHPYEPPQSTTREQLDLLNDRMGVMEATVARILELLEGQAQDRRRNGHHEA